MVGFATLNSKGTHQVSRMLRFRLSTILVCNPRLAEQLAAHCAFSFCLVALVQRSYSRPAIFRDMF